MSLNRDLSAVRQNPADLRGKVSKAKSKPEEGTGSSHLKTSKVKRFRATRLQRAMSLYVISLKRLQSSTISDHLHYRMLLTAPSSILVHLQSITHLLLVSWEVGFDSVTPWAAACQAPLTSTISQCLLKSMSIELVVLSNRLILCCPLGFHMVITLLLQLIIFTQH